MARETKTLSAMHQSMKNKEIEETEAIYVSPQKRQVRLGTADECGAFDDLTFSTVPRVQWCHAFDGAARSMISHFRQCHARVRMTTAVSDRASAKRRTGNADQLGAGRKPTSGGQTH